MKNYSRAHIQLTTMKDIETFVSTLNQDGTTNHYTLEDFDGNVRVNARSILGVIYFISEHGDDTYLVNDSDPFYNFPQQIDQFRV